MCWNVARVEQVDQDDEDALVADEAAGQDDAGGSLEDPAVYELCRQRLDALGRGRQHHRRRFLQRGNL